MDFSRKILIIDENRELRKLLASILLPGEEKPEDSIILEKIASILKGKEEHYRADAAENPREALRMANEAVATNSPYSVVYINLDCPGRKNLKIIGQIWELDSRTEIVLCLEDAGISWDELTSWTGKRDNLIVMSKPFGCAEFIQSAYALTRKYRMERSGIQRIKSLEAYEKSSRLATRRLMEIFQSLPSVLIATDAEGGIAEFNAAAKKFFGTDTGEVTGKKCWEISPLLENYRNQFTEVMESRKPQEFKRVEYGRSDRKYLNIYFYPLTYHDAAGVIIRIDDVTDAVIKDNYLLQMQKMDTVGNLATGLAHDFNNVVGGIKSNLSIIDFSLKHSGNDADKLRQDIENELTTIKASVDRGAEMVDQLFTLSRSKDLEFVPVDLKEVLEKVIGICRKTFPGCIEIKSDLPDKPAFAGAIPARIEQVFLNLCVNASHAMTFMREDKKKEGGTMTITLEMVKPGKFFSTILPGAVKRNYWLARVWDTGIGMDQDILSKIFDPFFSTKEKGRGTGLGLSMVYNIIQQHQGFIEAYSEPGAGAAFSIFLPVWAPEDEEKLNGNDLTPGQGNGKGF